MQPVFDLKKLEMILKDFYELSHIRITVFDAQFHELLTYPQGHCAVCALIRADARGTAACRACDVAACRFATERRGAHVYTCHAGLREAITPLYVDKALAGYLLIGQILAYPDYESAAAEIRRMSLGLNIDRARLSAACRESPLISESCIHAAAHILHAVASFLIMEKLADVKEDAAAEQLDSWLRAHYTESVSAQLICQQLGVGRTQLYALSQQLYGCGVMAQVRNMRIALAQKMLLKRRVLSVSTIAARCGYADYNYFISSFSRIVGKSPNRFRREK